MKRIEKIYQANNQDLFREHPVYPQRIRQWVDKSFNGPRLRF